MNTLGYQDELEMDLMLEEAREPDIDSTEEDQREMEEEDIGEMEDAMEALPETKVIETFITWLWNRGFNEWIINVVEKMLLKGQERKNG